MLAIYKRELKSYFISPIGYVFIALFLIASGIAFAATTLMASTADIANYYSYILFLFVVLIPLLTMKLLSEERKLKTEQVLLTAPVSLVRIITAKYLAALTLFTGTLLLSTVNFIGLYMYGTPNTSILISSTIGIFFIGSAFIAIGLFVSALTENQLVSALASVFIILALLALGLVSASITNDFLRVIVKWISIFDRYYSFNYGLFDFNALLYYISISVVFIFLTVRVYEKRRWE